MTNEADHLLPDRGPRYRAMQQRAIDKIDAVVDATVRVLEREGEKAVRIAEICDVTGVSYGTVYHHFGDRNGLIRAAQFARLSNQPGQDIDAFATALESEDLEGDFVNDLLRICRAIADPSRGPVRRVRTSVLATAEHDDEFLPSVTTLETETMTELTKTLERAKSAGIVDQSVDSLSLASFVSAVAYGLVLLDYNEHRPNPDDLAAVILRGFAAFMPQS
ncbi:TetR/AcrR family transcriptional regulator [Ilumatobacteraceae bacterium]|nr:TetR/AcrR family transcriptional regulator [Ilumatobacteraceae bacterium]